MISINNIKSFMPDISRPQYNSVKNVFVSNPACDTVSFSAKKRNTGKNSISFDTQLEKSRNVKQAASAGKELFLLSDKSLEGIESKISDINPPVPISVFDIKADNIQLPENTVAHMLPYYDQKDLTLKYANIYLNPNEKDTNTLIADSAHEYTHVLQRANDKDYYGYKELFNGSVYDSITAARFSQSIMGNITREYNNKILSDPQIQKTRKNGKINFTTPEIQKICDKGRQMNTAIDQFITSCVDDVVESGAIDIDKDTLNKAVRMFIKQEALNEAEAYTVTLQTLKYAGNYNREIYCRRNIQKCLHSAIYNAM